MRPNRDTALRWLRQAAHDLRIARDHQERGDYSDSPDALAPPAVPFESYTQEQGERAVAAVQAIVSLVMQTLLPPQDA